MHTCWGLNSCSHILKSGSWSTETQCGPACERLSPLRLFPQGLHSQLQPELPLRETLTFFKQTKLTSRWAVHVRVKKATARAPMHGVLSLYQRAWTSVSSVSHYSCYCSWNTARRKMRRRLWYPGTCGRNASMVPTYDCFRQNRN